MSQLHPRAARGPLTAEARLYGHSVMGAPLLWFPAPAADENSGLILAGTHGDEVAAVVALSCAMRTLQQSSRRHHVVLAVNPDGCQLGLRANARGVDLNRNFPAANWQSGETVYRWNSDTEERDVVLSTGERAGSEPETQALCTLIHQLKPRWIVSFHEPLACIDDPLASPVSRWLAEKMSLPLVDDVGYATPGSFGSWCGDLGLNCVTAELPAISADAAIQHYLPALVALLHWQAA
ncbi:murein peptide amidase A [Erwinia sp. OLTSP20]|uniref:murein tripeptide amidase MpaA n=1 Tax=unclassified Erwinia TaxID=2622719 RepID=UPI000C18BAFC|nr:MULTISPECIES: murein tripeptide amidase MpaA [unclassified Erwinia]PIJ51766.1 murein peptide amidase A [Erwinia sp. OAMSP11]PIJ74355.1 murein peptide amidase A [Erwinia sp. OLSSP12]PIJ83812.1 murein peptide amidase A [Erwinia sp. OLCASP19]PIJ86855.1 murein peptide amidase A [Erwinia sp. OLMTSP26]PIJ88262.1 murein peptide amidase A [Erwinia sp. OLMDSP33]